jgi:hypothetical protein
MGIITRNTCFFSRLSGKFIISIFLTVIPESEILCSFLPVTTIWKAEVEGKTFL